MALFALNIMSSRCSCSCCSQSQMDEKKREYNNKQVCNICLSRPQQKDEQTFCNYDNIAPKLSEPDPSIKSLLVCRHGCLNSTNKRRLSISLPSSQDCYNNIINNYKLNNIYYNISKNNISLCSCRLPVHCNQHQNNFNSSFLRRFSSFFSFLSSFSSCRRIFAFSSLSFWSLNLLTFLCVLSLAPAPTEALHLQGVWRSDDFFLFLAKFGFQKTDPRDLANTQGIIYGQVLPRTNDDPHQQQNKKLSFTPNLTLVLVDSEYFMEYYGNRSSSNPSKCKRMFNKIDTIAFDYQCKPKGQEDFLRKVPCQENQLCIDEDNPKDVIDGFQFTYRIRDLERPRFWYLSMTSCHREIINQTTCEWVQSPTNIEIAYDIWMVNGHPSTKHINPFEHQFSFELHDVVEIYLIALLLYCILLPIWLRACNKLTQHPVTKLLTLNIVLELVGILLNFLHVIKFAFDGIGLSWLSIIGNGIDVLAECLFVLLVLVIAKGWAITRIQLEGKWIVFSVWGFYTFLNALLFVWNLTEIDIISNIDEWQTGPGYLTLLFRIVIMLWFLFELRRTFHNDPQSKRLLFFQHFGAGILVWFFYLPVLVMISSQISALWRYKTILSITYGADYLSAICLVHLLWPSRSVLYLIKQDGLIGTYEMEVTGFLEGVTETSSTAQLLPNEEIEKTKDNDDSSLQNDIKTGHDAQKYYKEKHGQVTLKAPVPTRSPKLSSDEPVQYLDG